MPDNAYDPPRWEPDDQGPLSLAEAVGQSLGAASMCWVGGTGQLEFDSVRCVEINDWLMAYLADWGDKIRREANEATSAKLIAKERWQ
jgi:hypothetical protein